jgi:integrase
MNKDKKRKPVATKGYKGVFEVEAKGRTQYEVRVSRGRHLARKCARCPRRYWTEEPTPKRCTATNRKGEVCGGELGAPALFLLQREKRFANKGEAKQWLLDQQAAHLRGESPFDQVRELPTLADYVEEYLKRKKTRVVRETWIGYNRMLRTYALPVAGHKPIDEVTKLDVRTMVDSIIDAGLARQTAAQFKSILANALNEAVEVDLLVANVATAVKIDKTEGKRAPKLVIPAWSDVLALVESAKGTRWYIPLVLCSSIGALRRSEALGLAWASVDLDGKNRDGTPSEDGAGFRVEATMHILERGELDRRESTKSEDGDRWVPLAPDQVALLRRHRLEQAPGAGLVCTTPEGGPLHPDTFTRTFRRMADRAGLDKRVHLHSVRHAVVKELRRRKWPNTVIADLVGHADPAFTEARYGGKTPPEVLRAVSTELHVAAG